MEEYLLEGKLNPKLEPTRKGFLKIFAAWILQEDLPYTTGKAPALKQLFEYLQIRFMLPSHTTVRNTLAEIFISLYGTVVEELAVSARVQPDWSVGSNLSNPARQVKNIVRT